MSFSFCKMAIKKIFLASILGGVAQFGAFAECTNLPSSVVHSSEKINLSSFSGYYFTSTNRYAIASSVGDLTSRNGMDISDLTLPGLRFLPRISWNVSPKNYKEPDKKESELIIYYSTRF